MLTWYKKLLLKEGKLTMTPETHPSPTMLLFIILMSLVECGPRALFPCITDSEMGCVLLTQRALTSCFSLLYCTGFVLSGEHFHSA